MKTLAERFEEKVDRVNGTVPAHRPELGPCHLWIGRIGDDGYGTIIVDGRRERAPRVGFLLKHGRWPHPSALHHCDNPPCVRDEHVFEGTQRDNMKDMAAKGRMFFQQHPERLPRGERSGSHTKPERRAWGDRNGSRTHPETRDSRCRPKNPATGDRNGSRLHPERVARGEAAGMAKLTAQVVLQIRSEHADGVPRKVISEKLGVTYRNVIAILNRRTWRHV